MDGVGLVAYVEGQLERDIALGRLPECGRFGSEQKLARSHGVSRGTVREALRRLAARGLVMQHPGRKTRAVALDTSMTLENLGVALHDERTEQGRWWLEGFFSLKRQVLVELLADCCANASDVALSQLESACFRLWDAGRWEPGVHCAQLEFELLVLAARAVDRPGHLLLIQSLRRAFRGTASRLLPHMGGEALRQWVSCATEALSARDVKALQHTLPGLLKACDEAVLARFAPVSQTLASSKDQCVPPSCPDEPVLVSRDEASRTCSSLENPDRTCSSPTVVEDAAALEREPLVQSDAPCMDLDCGSSEGPGTSGFNLGEDDTKHVEGEVSEPTGEGRLPPPSERFGGQRCGTVREDGGAADSTSRAFALNPPRDS
jgi:GntR family transcriptional regulator, transcriptional repressor for pyruvate dehydrogenase complex